MRISSVIVALSLTMAGPAPAVDKATTRPIVIEYFTSQGCSSCPPADAFLEDELSKRDDVIALAYHVDYWDDLGWKDTFSQHRFTTRQYAYRQAMNQGSESAGKVGVYTPQMIVEGRFAAIGSRRAAVYNDIDAARDTLVNVPITLKDEDGQPRLTIAADSGATTPATLWLVGYLKSAPVAIKHGENSGRTITYVNIVRDMRVLARWNGRALSIALPELSADESYVALLQADETGPILGALRINSAR